MHKLVHNLALSIVLYHLLVGCCGHHAHVDNGNPHHDELAAACCSHHGHSHSSEGYNSGSPDQPDREHGGCHDSQCVFVVPSPGSSARLASHVNPLVPLNLASQATSTLYTLRTTSEAPPPAVVAPLRLHLLHQILLI